MARIDPIESLVEYVQEVKPYHTKVIDVLVEYVYEESIAVSFEEKLEFDIQIDFDRFNRICFEGFGFPGLGKLEDGEMPLNPLYNPASGNYVPQLDRNNALYDPTYLASSPGPSQLQKDVSLVYLEYVEGSPGLASNWDNFDCSSQQESLLQTTITETFDLGVDRDCSFAGDFYITLDREEFYQYNLSNAQAVQSAYAGSPGSVEGRTYGNIVLDGTAGGKYYWEYLLDSISVGDTSTFSVGVAYYDDALNPPFEVPTEHTQRVGEDANSYGYLASGDFLTANTTSGTPSTLSSSDVVGVAFDLDVGQVTFYRNNTSQGTVPIANTNLTFSPAISMELTNSGSTVTLQASGSLTYTPPIGFIALTCPASSPGSP